MEAPLPESSHRDAVVQRTESAVRQYRRATSSSEERRAAVRALADVLEYIRPKVKEHLLSKDESALFQIANQFGIRHHNEFQRTSYDEDLWLEWLFHWYLSTIHLVEELAGRRP